MSDGQRLLSARNTAGTHSRLPWLLVALPVLLLTAEWAARVLFGLGNPVLYVSDPAIEYMLRPNQDLRRFGKHVLVNQYGMRSAAFPEHKTSADELRVLVIGDSVVNGGNRADQSQLATTLLQERLAAATQRAVVVGNVAAGSWGPPNMLAWTHAFGFLAADVVIVVLSSHDASDVPTFGPLDPITHPTSRPVSALLEGAVNYLPRLWSGEAPDEGVAAELRSDMRAPNADALDALRQLVREARSAGACIGMVQHLTRAELIGRPGPGHEALGSLAGELGVMDRDDIRIPAAAAALYRDNIHFNDAGQRALAGVLFEAVTRCAAQ